MKSFSKASVVTLLLSFALLSEAFAQTIPSIPEGDDRAYVDLEGFIFTTPSSATGAVAFEVVGVQNFYIDLVNVVAGTEFYLDIPVNNLTIGRSIEVFTQTEPMGDNDFIIEIIEAAPTLIAAGSSATISLTIRFRHIDPRFIGEEFMHPFQTRILATSDPVTDGTADYDGVHYGIGTSPGN